MDAPKTQNTKTGPPASLRRLVTLLTPRSYRFELARQLQESFTGTPSYCAEAGFGIGLTTLLSAREARDRNRLAGDLCCIYAAFAAAPAFPLAAILLIAILVLQWRDGHSFPPAPSPQEALVDAVAVMAFIMFWEAIAAYVVPSLAVPLGILRFALPRSIAMISIWRFVYRMEKPRLDPSDNDLITVWRINWVWIVGAVSLIISNSKGLPESWDLFRKDFWFTLIPYVTLIVSQRLKTESIGPIGVRNRNPIHSIGVHPEAQFLEIKRNRLLRGGFLVEKVFFGMLALPIPVTVLNVALGVVSAQSVNWAQWSANIAAFLILTKMWREILKINETMRAAMKKKIDALNAASSL